MESRQTRSDNTPVKADFEVPQTDVPTSARVVIVGGGIAGCSIAYHFARAGWSDIVLLEQNKISSGTTWHAAGMVGQLRSSSAQTQVNKASAELYSRLGSETGHDPGWLACGGLQLATCSERMHQLQRTAAMAKVFGVEAELISADDCLAHWPMLSIDDIEGAVFLPGDGRVLPGECTVALAKGALAGNVKMIEGIRIHSLIGSENRQGIQTITGVETDRGPILAEWVVLANNMWMRQIGLSSGIDLPVYPCEHHYLITRPIPGVTRDCPCTRDPDSSLYFRALDDGGMKLGAFQKRSKPWQIDDQVPDEFAFSLLEPDWPKFEQPFRDLQHRLPGLSREDIVRFVNGPEAFTPDNNFLIGQPFCTRGLFVCGGWNSAGIACAGGAGKYAVEWIENGGMTLDLTSVDVRRFLPFQNNRQYLQERASEVLGLHYQMAWPGREMETARNQRASAVYSIHQEQHACFGQASGWERPLFFANDCCPPKIEYSFVRQNWHDCVAEEVLHCRQQVALIDQSTFGKLMFLGPDALDILQRICSAEINRPIGHTIYTGMLNDRGGFESDLTVTRLDVDRFLIVTATAHQRRDFDWISRHIRDHEKAQLLDTTEEFDVLSVMGPDARETMKGLCDFDFSDEAFPFATARELKMDQLSLLAIRISYVGELGWEIHVPVEHSARVYQHMLETGKEFGIQAIGNYAVNAMRIEKGFRALGHELSPSETPLEAGLSFTIDWDKEFLGKQALLNQKKTGLKKRLACFVLDDPEVVLWGSEPILWNGQVSGYTTSGCYGPSIGSSVAMGYVTRPDGQPLKRSALEDGQFEIIQRGKNYSAAASWKSPLQMKVEGR